MRGSETEDPGPDRRPAAARRSCGNARPPQGLRSVRRRGGRTCAGGGTPPPMVRRARRGEGGPAFRHVDPGSGWDRGAQGTVVCPCSPPMVLTSRGGPACGFGPPVLSFRWDEGPVPPEKLRCHCGIPRIRHGDRGLGGQGGGTSTGDLDHRKWEDLTEGRGPASRRLPSWFLFSFLRMPSPPPPIRNQLRSMFNYPSYRLVERLKRTLSVGETGDFGLPGNRSMRVTPVPAKGNKVRLAVPMMEAERNLLTTTLGLTRGGMVLVGGPPYQKGVLILIISAE